MKKNFGLVQLSIVCIKSTHAYIYINNKTLYTYMHTYILYIKMNKKMQAATCN